MRKSRRALNRLSLLLALCALLTACPPPGGKLTPLAGDKVRVVTLEDTGLTAEAQQDDVTIDASGNWSTGGTDVLLNVKNASRQAVQIDFNKVRLSDSRQRVALLGSLLEYTQHGAQQQSVPLYMRANGSPTAAVITIAANATRRLQSGFSYPGDADAGGKFDDEAMLTVPVQASPSGKLNDFAFGFKYAGH